LARDSLPRHWRHCQDWQTRTFQEGWSESRSQSVDRVALGQTQSPGHLPREGTGRSWRDCHSPPTPVRLGPLDTNQEPRPEWHRNPLGSLVVLSLLLSHSDLEVRPPRLCSLAQPLAQRTSPSGRLLITARGATL